MSVKNLIGKYYMNRKSHKLYKCMDCRVVEEVDPDMPQVFLERLGDRKAYVHPIDNFILSYVELGPQELELIEQNQERINNSTQAITLEWLANPEPESAVGILITPTEHDDFSRLVISPDVIKSKDIALAKINLKQFLNEQWNMKSIEPMDGRCGLNMFGPPGTGKTFFARALAKQLGKKLYLVNYSQIVSKWVGDTGKHLAECFKVSKDKDAILFFDEADSMLSRRIGLGEGDAAYSSSINQNRNILMQEIDRHNGIVLFATNLFGNYDEALLRRIAQHIEFKLPTKEMREKIFALHVPKEVTRDSSIDFSKCAELSGDFSGGDIKNACINAVIAAAMDTPQVLKQINLFDEITKIRDSKSKHKSGGKKKNPIGIGVNYTNDDDDA